MKHTVPPFKQDAEPLNFDDCPLTDDIHAPAALPTEDQVAAPMNSDRDLLEGYFRSDGCIYFEATSGGRGKTSKSGQIRVCDDIKLLGRGSTPDGQWGRLIAFKDPHGAERRIVIPFRHLAGDGKEARAILLAAGIMTASDRAGRDALANLLMSGGDDTIYHLADRLGWYRDHFVMPDEIISPENPQSLVAYDQPGAEHPFRAEGTLKEWQRICAILEHIAYAVICIAAAFAGPLLRIIGAESGGVHIYGPSSRGKTQIARFAGSVFGAPDEIVRPWHATINGIEARAVDACDTLLILDEIGQSDGRGPNSDIARITYMLANGAGKGRANKTGGLQQGSSWRVLAISTGEHPIADLVRDHHNGQRMSGGVGVRMIDLPILTQEILVSENETHPERTRQLLDDARTIISKNFGHAGPEFVRRIVADPDAARAAVEKMMAHTMAIFSDQHDDPQVTRVAKRLALIIAAGKLAEDFGILTWPSGTSECAGGKAFGAWKEQRGSRSSLEELNAVTSVRLFLESHGEARFRQVTEIGEGDYDISSPSADRGVANRAGFRAETADGEAVWYILPEIWKAEVCRGQDPNLVGRTLKKRGFLLPGEGDHLGRKVRLPGMPNSTRFYVITAKIFADEDLR